MKTENHPIGFKKYVLLSLFGYRLRLHVWPRGQGTDSRHNHRWWFVSMPLVGRFIDTRYEETAATTGDLIKIDVADKGGVRDGVRAYRMLGESGLKVKKSRIRRPFLPYLCRLGEIHSYVPYGPGLHASLVFIGRLQIETSEIWRSPDNIDVELGATQKPSQEPNETAS